MNKSDRERRLTRDSFLDMLSLVSASEVSTMIEDGTYIEPLDGKQPLPTKPSAFCQKATQIVKMVDNMLDRDVPSINADYWLEAQRNVAKLHQLCMNAKTTFEDSLLELEIRRIIAAERPWFTKYNVLTDKLRALIKSVDDSKFPLEIHRHLEEMFEEKDEQLRAKEAIIKELENQAKQADEVVKQMETSVKYVETIKTLDTVEKYKRKMVEDNRTFDQKLKQTEEKLKAENAEINRKYQDLMREYKKVLDNQQSEFERGAHMFLTYQDNVEGQVSEIQEQYMKALGKKNQQIESLTEEIEYLKKTIYDSSSQAEVTLTKQATTIAQQNFKLKQMEKTVMELQQQLDLYRLADDPVRRRPIVEPEPIDRVSLADTFDNGGYVSNFPNPTSPTSRPPHARNVYEEQRGRGEEQRRLSSSAYSSRATSPTRSVSRGYSGAVPHWDSLDRRMEEVMRRDRDWETMSNSNIKM